MSEEGCKADWEFLRDTVTPSPFYHNEHAWSVMWSLIEKRIAATRPAPKADGLVEAAAGHFARLDGHMNADETELADAILAALKDRDVVLEEAAKVAESVHYKPNPRLGGALTKLIANRIRNLKERV